VYGRNLHEHVNVRALAHPVDLRAMHRLAPERYPFLLQSTATAGPLGRHDILFAFPGEALEATTVCRTGGEPGSFLEELDQWWRREYRPPVRSNLPFTGGWFLYLGYELAQEIEPSLCLPADTVLPAAFAVRCQAAVVFDHVHDQAFWVVERGARIDHQQFIADLETVSGQAADDPTGVSELRSAVEEPADFMSAVGRVKQYIAAGDIYQANLSRQWSVDVEDGSAPSDIYASLCAANPAPFAGLARWRNATIMSSSPERLLAVRDGRVSTRPIAGTRPRAANTTEDDALLRELIAHPKERAEHVMLIDLERNDLGRICEPGTVEVDEMMVLESYAHVHHIVSNVRGRLRHDVDPGDTIRAVFPGGTITGCPKVRCMEIIAELEGVPRGAYTGSFGYLNRDGSLDLNILIRTMVMQGNTLSFRAGCGIVADSEPVAELSETEAKAAGLLKALSQ
jgi:anthranilate synthase component 1